MPTGHSQISAASRYDKPEDLGQHEGQAALGVEPGQERLHRHRPGRVGLEARALEPGGQPAPAAEVAHGVGTGAAGDRQQPGAGAGVAPEGRQRPVGPEEHLLGHVVGLVPADELRAQAPHLALAPLDPGGQGEAVAVLGGEQELGELVGAGHVRSFSFRAGTSEANHMTTRVRWKGPERPARPPHRHSPYPWLPSTPAPSPSGRRRESARRWTGGTRRSRRFWPDRPRLSFRPLWELSADKGRLALGVTPRPLRLRWLFAVVLGVGVVFGSAGPAFAHAQLTSTEPVGGTAVATPPANVVLHFGENVEIPLGSIRVFASPSGKQIETGAAEHAGGQGSAVSVKLPKLDKGTYIVTWRVTSADSHPVHGAFTFIVGSGKGTSQDAALAARAPVVGRRQHDGRCRLRRHPLPGLRRPAPAGRRLRLRGPGVAGRPRAGPVPAAAVVGLGRGGGDDARRHSPSRACTPPGCRCRRSCRRRCCRGSSTSGSGRSRSPGWGSWS